MHDATMMRHPLIPEDRGAEWVPGFGEGRVWRPATPLSQAMAAGTAPTSEAIPARAEHGRWIVDCPDCNNAQLACKTDHRFMCNECGNIAAGGLWRVVVWPKEHESIAAILDKRHVSRAHWNPGQTVAHLEAEDKAQSDVPAALLKPLEEWHDPDPKKPHVHAWPKHGDEYEGLVECKGCGLVLPHREIAHGIEAEAEAARKAAKK